MNESEGWENQVRVKESLLLAGLSTCSGPPQLMNYVVVRLNDFQVNV